MTISLDTNVVIALINQEERLNVSAKAAIEKARGTGRVLICGPVCAELLGLPARNQAALDEFFNLGGIDVDWLIDEAVWRAAGTAFRNYVGRRIESTGLLPRRILTGFLIGAHAVAHGYTLLTLDQRHYKASFPEIRLQSILGML
jgi:predicted nucleic acid-binding protein